MPESRNPWFATYHDIRRCSSLHKSKANDRFSYSTQSPSAAAESNTKRISRLPGIGWAGKEQGMVPAPLNVNKKTRTLPPEQKTPDFAPAPRPGQLLRAATAPQQGALKPKHGHTRSTSDTRRPFWSPSRAAPRPPLPDPSHSQRFSVSARFPPPLQLVPLDGKSKWPESIINAPMESLHTISESVPLCAYRTAQLERAIDVVESHGLQHSDEKWSVASLYAFEVLGVAALLKGTYWSSNVMEENMRAYGEPTREAGDTCSTGYRGEERNEKKQKKDKVWEGEAKGSTAPNECAGWASDSEGSVYSQSARDTILKNTTKDDSMPSLTDDDRSPTQSPGPATPTGISNPDNPCLTSIPPLAPQPLPHCGAQLPNFKFPPRTPPPAPPPPTISHSPVADSYFPRTSTEHPVQRSYTEPPFIESPTVAASAFAADHEPEPKPEPEPEPIDPIFLNELPFFGHPLHDDTPVRQSTFARAREGAAADVPVCIAAERETTKTKHARNPSKDRHLRTPSKGKHSRNVSKESNTSHRSAESPKPPSRRDSPSSPGGRPGILQRWGSSRGRKAESPARGSPGPGPSRLSHEEKLELERKEQHRKDIEQASKKMRELSEMLKKKEAVATSEKKAVARGEKEAIARGETEAREGTRHVQSIVQGLRIRGESDSDGSA